MSANDDALALMRSMESATLVWSHKGTINMRATPFIFTDGNEMFPADTHYLDTWATGSAPRSFPGPVIIDVENQRITGDGWEIRNAFTASTAEAFVAFDRRLQQTGHSFDEEWRWYAEHIVPDDYQHLTA